MMSKSFESRRQSLDTARRLRAARREMPRLRWHLTQDAFSGGRAILGRGMRGVPARGDPARPLGRRGATLLSGEILRQAEPAVQSAFRKTDSSVPQPAGPIDR